MLNVYIMVPLPFQKWPWTFSSVNSPLTGEKLRFKDSRPPAEERKSAPH